MLRSILQRDRNSCYLCGRNGSADPLDVHHVFFGPYRGKSEKYGLVVRLCHDSCHIFGAEAVHRNGAVCRALQKRAQEIFMERYRASEEEFIRLFGRSYL